MPQDPLLPRPVRIGLGLVVSFGWLVPALVAWRLAATAARQPALRERHLNSFPYESVAADFAAVAWWWALVAALGRALAAAAWLRWRRSLTSGRRWF